mmetsp:Transcript_13882/g.37545  ORF Transcript_13882/g.37545 Transcript_13882/m.37545 type:complete len:224 (-) Transcript_13882:945-1616(-)
MVKVYGKPLAKARRVVVPNRFRVAKGLKDRRGLLQQRLDCHWRAGLVRAAHRRGETPLALRTALHRRVGRRAELAQRRAPIGRWRGRCPVGRSAATAAAAHAVGPRLLGQTRRTRQVFDNPLRCLRLAGARLTRDEHGLVGEDASGRRCCTLCVAELHRRAQLRVGSPRNCVHMGRRRGVGSPVGRAHGALKLIRLPARHVVQLGQRGVRVERDEDVPSPRVY